jgi:hypothetical protein
MKEPLDNSKTCEMRHEKSVGINPDNGLDERQLHTRNEAYLTAYRLFGVILGVAGVLGFWYSLRQVTNSFPVGIIVLIMLALSLPAAVLAWLEPEPIKD